MEHKLPLWLAARSSAAPRQPVHRSNPSGVVDTGYQEWTVWVRMPETGAAAYRG
jgi:dUTPase